MKTPLLVTQPCVACERKVAVGVTNDGRKVVLDPALPVYERVSDGEGGAVWLRPQDETFMALHRCGVGWQTAPVSAEGV